MQKKYQLQEERNTEIDRDNRLLYHKIANAGRKSQPSTLHSITSQPRRKKKMKTTPAERTSK